MTSLQHPDYREIGKRFRRKADRTDAAPLMYTQGQLRKRI